MLAGIKDDLLEVGKNEGCITFQHLNELLPDDINDPKAIEEIFDFLGENNIEIVTQEKSGKKKTLVRRGLDRQKHVQSRTRKAKPCPTAKTTKARKRPPPTCREMGQFDLLTPDEEAKYSKSIREGFDAIIDGHPQGQVRHLGDEDAGGTD